MLWWIPEGESSLDADVLQAREDHYEAPDFDLGRSEVEGCRFSVKRSRTGWMMLDAYQDPRSKFVLLQRLLSNEAISGTVMSEKLLSWLMYFESKEALHRS